MCIVLEHGCVVEEHGSQVVTRAVKLGVDPQRSSEFRHCGAEQRPRLLDRPRAREFTEHQAPVVERLGVVRLAGQACLVLARGRR